VSDLERPLSKHLAIRLTNAVALMDVCVVHLRRPMGNGGAEKQVEQNRALLQWAMGHLSKNPKANLVILGDFNESKPVGSPEQSLARDTWEDTAVEARWRDAIWLFLVEHRWDELKLWPTVNLIVLSSVARELCLESTAGALGRFSRCQVEPASAMNLPSRRSPMPSSPRA
jgi:hypothetical protein